MSDGPPESTFQDEADQSGRWYVSISGEVYGPADRATLTQWAAEGRLGVACQVCREGQQQWAPLSSVPELRALPLPPPPAPGSPYAQPRPAASAPQLPPTTGQALPPRGGVCSCPYCGGPVDNLAPAYGLLFGVFERTLRPDFKCLWCGRKIERSQMPPKVQEEVGRRIRNGWIVWIAITVPLLALFIWVFIIRRL